MLLVKIFLVKKNPFSKNLFRKKNPFSKNLCNKKNPFSKIILLVKKTLLVKTL